MLRAASTLPNRTPIRLGHALFDTALGACGIVWGKEGIRRLILPERSRGQVLARISALRSDEVELEEGKPPAPVRRVIKQLTRQLDGKPGPPLDATIDLVGQTPFVRRVYEALQRVPAGETVTYGELAALAGSPKAARAVGRAMATNPMPLIIPCHRVVAANGKPGGFTAYGGVATKSALLAIEGVTLPGAPELPFDRDEAAKHLRRVDPQLKKLMQEVGPKRFTLEQPKTPFAALAEAIVYQQLNGRAAAAIFSRTCALFPKDEITPRHVADASEDELLSAGLSRAKMAALQDLADKALTGVVPTRAKLERMDDEAIIEALTAVRGVGRWTVEMLLIFQLGRPDVLPVGDYAVRKAYSAMRGHEGLIKPKDMVADTQSWRPFRTLASWYLWRSLELD